MNKNIKERERVGAHGCGNLTKHHQGQGDIRVSTAFPGPHTRLGQTWSESRCWFGKLQTTRKVGRIES